MDYAKTVTDAMQAFAPYGHDVARSICEEVVRRCLVAWDFKADRTAQERVRVVYSRVVLRHERAHGLCSIELKEAAERIVEAMVKCWDSAPPDRRELFFRASEALRGNG